ncbi:MAG: MFS transporter [Chloroflexi bacterium]|nr:MFS transporter [Chloroflexota bacterium]
MNAFGQIFAVWRSSFSPLRFANLRIYLSGQAVSLIGTWLQLTAQSLLVYQLSGGSATALGIVAVASAFPMLVFSLWVGAFADRFDRRKLLIATQIGEMILAFILAWLVQSERAQLWHVYVLAFLLGTLESIVFPTQQAFLADVVSIGEIRKAVTLNSMIINVSRAIGPAIAGFIVGRFGLALTFWLNGLSFLAVIWSLIVIRIESSLSETVRHGSATSLSDGLRYIRDQPQVRNIVLAVAVLNAFGLSVYAIAPALVAGDAANTGLLLGAAGAGSLFTVFFIMPFVNNVRRVGVMLSGGLIWMGFCLTLLSRSSWFPLSLLAIFLAGISTTIVWVGALGLLQVIPPPNMRARMFAMFSIVSFGVQPIAALLLGSLADQISPPSAVLLSSLTMALIGILMLLQAAWRNWQFQPTAEQGTQRPTDVSAELSQL